jgi:signal transduction histidine kinase
MHSSINKTSGIPKHQRQSVTKWLAGLRRLSLRFKLTAAFILIASFVMVGTYYQWRALHSAHRLFTNLVENNVSRQTALEDMQATIHETYYNILLQKYVAHGAYTSSSHLNETRAQLTADQTQYRLHIVPDDENRQASLSKLQKISADTQVFLAQATALEKLSSDVSSVELQGKEQAFIHSWEALDTFFGTALQDERQVADKQQEKATQEAQRASSVTLIAALLPVLAAVILGLGLSRTIARRITRLRVSAQQMAQGNFSRPLPVGARDELGELTTAFNQMSGHLRELYQHLALEKQRDEALIENMAEGVIAIDASNKVSLVNSVATKLLNLPSPAEVLGTPLASTHQLHHLDGKPLKKEEYPGRTALYESKAVNDVYMFFPEPDRKVLVNVAASPVIVDTKTVGAIILVRDVTKEREVDRMKTEFISLASHQLRTPLSAIKWYTEMLLSGDAGALKRDQKEFAQNIYDSSSRMVELVSSLLNISRIESGRIIVDPKPTDLKELVSGIVTDLKAKTEERQQTLIISVHKDLPQIKLDPHLVGQVYMNLLTNAIKYTPKGGEISVFVSKKDGYVLSQVTDNGYGIPKSQHDRVFQKFFRAQNIVKVETDGTGLGLYLIKAIIESSGGKIWFDSEEGKGTTFWFTLPLTGMKAKEGEVTLDS